MNIDRLTISVKGKPVSVPCLRVGSANVISLGTKIRIAVIHDDEWIDPAKLPEPEEILQALKTSPLKADLFSFAPAIPDNRPPYAYPMEWDNVAVIPITTYDEWWEKLPQVARRNVRTAAKKGVSVQVIPFDDALVKGIVTLYNETSFRNGRPFWHFGKDFATVQRENATYLDTSDFIGAFHEGNLIGFIKLVYVGRIGSIMQILSMVQHQDKRTTNALIAKAVELCVSKGMSHLKYCNYVYGANESSLLTDFKKRNGFERLNHPRYFVPLTTKGRLALKLRLHRSVKDLLPPPLVRLALRLRTRYYDLRSQRDEASTE